MVKIIRDNDDKGILTNDEGSKL